MDAPLNPMPDDRRLAALFQEAGPVNAPNGIEERVMQRIAVLPRPSSVTVKPLLPHWMLFLAGALTVGLMLASIRTGSGMATGQPDSGVVRALSSEWVLAAALCLACLAALDRLFVRSRISSN